MERLENIRKIRVKLRKVYYKYYQKVLKLGCSTLYLKFIDNLNYYNIMIEYDNELKNMLRLYHVYIGNKCKTS